MTALVWYRNDLRVGWHTPLAAAARSGLPVRAVYIVCPQQWDLHEVAPLRRWYVLHSLKELGQALAQRGIALDVIDGSDFAAVPQLLQCYVREHDVAQLYANREYPLNEMRRDRRVAELMQADGVVMHGFDDGILVPPRELKTTQGKYYTVFTPYRRSWQRWLDSNPPTSPALASAHKEIEFHSEVLDRHLASCQPGEVLTQRWQAGEKHARQQLRGFIEAGLGDYQAQRDYPALAGTSLLSTALSAGTLSVAQCYQAAQPALQDRARRDGASTWIGELCWRDFYRQIMANFPQLARGEPFRTDTGYLQWSRDKAAFARWCEGRTGFPLVDAAMRQLVSTGWMHNRLRMVVAMFLTKQLFIDWRWGEQFFMQHLIDGDFAANNGGWQWSASTGTDAVPYFRVFNPVRQSQRFDPQGEFIRTWVPELAGLQGKDIHEPWRKPGQAPDYPAPMIELKGVKERVEQAFRQARELAQVAGE